MKLTVFVGFFWQKALAITIQPGIMLMKRGDKL